MTWGLDSVRVSYGHRVAPASVTVAAQPAGITVVVGGDGAGKSTALRALVGLVRRPSKTQIGYVPATAGLYPDLTVRENLVFSAAAYGISGAELEQRLADVLSRVGLAGFPHRLGGHLSGGMQRKLAVAMALVHSPQLLVLDEPTTGVDPVSRRQLCRLIAGAAASGAAVVVATTYVHEAERGTCSVLLEAGHMLASGSARDIVNNVPGALGTTRSVDQPTPLSWRRGTEWRVWAPAGDLPAGARAVSPDIGDAAVIAELAAETAGVL
jgi:ABC-2 type transport system ATP-binding protein